MIALPPSPPLHVISRHDLYRLDALTSPEVGGALCLHSASLNLLPGPLHCAFHDGKNLSSPLSGFLFSYFAPQPHLRRYHRKSRGHRTGTLPEPFPGLLMCLSASPARRNLTLTPGYFPLSPTSLPLTARQRRSRGYRPPPAFGTFPPPDRSVPLHCFVIPSPSLRYPDLEPSFALRCPSPQGLNITKSKG